MKSADEPPVWFMIVFVSLWITVLLGVPAVALAMLSPQG